MENMGMLTRWETTQKIDYSRSCNLYSPQKWFLTIVLFCLILTNKYQQLVIFLHVNTQSSCTKGCFFQTQKANSNTAFIFQKWRRYSGGHSKWGRWIILRTTKNTRNTHVRLQVSRRLKKNMLVVSTPLKNISQIGNLPQGLGWT